MTSNPQGVPYFVEHDYGNYFRPITNSPTQMLKKELVKYNISNQPNFPNATYSEYFAILAIALVGETLDEFNFLLQELPKNKKDKEIFLLKVSGAIAFEAMEAIGMAEIHLKNDEIIKETKKLKLEEWRIKRHGPILELEMEFINYYLSGSFPSRREAARRFYNNLPEKKKKLLTPDNAVRTLTDALRKFEKGEFRFTQNKQN